MDTNNIATKRRVAFRTVAVVTGNDTDPDYIKQSTNASGTASHGLFLRVNGAAMWARGANVVPTEVLEGRDTAERQQQLVASAAAAGFNTMRVWGGGAYSYQGPSTTRATSAVYSSTTTSCSRRAATRPAARSLNGTRSGTRSAA